MRHFVIFIKAILFLNGVTSKEIKVIEGKLPDASIITNLINEYVKPYFNSLDSPLNATPGFRATKETFIESVIRQKILELKPFLQDDAHKIIESEENLTLNNGEETTIIEFTANDTDNKDIGRNREDNAAAFKADIKAYKMLREKIKKALKKEPVSEKTVKLVTETFDGLIAKLIGSQCMWKSTDNAEKTFRFGKTDEHKLLKMHNITKKEWENFKRQYLKLNKNNYVNTTLKMFDKMKGFFERMIDNTISQSNRYTVKCRLVELKKPETNEIMNTNVLRDNSDGEECSDFEICSNELTIFMKDFYNSLNDTAVSAFRNYAAMYSRDVTTEHSMEKDSVVNLVNNISNTVERKVIRIFAKETQNIKLDEHKNKEENRKIIMRYINSTTGHVKRHIKKHLEKYLKSLRLRLLLNVKRDIDVNLSVDLGNLGRDFMSRLCTLFITCNGKYLSRRAKHLNPWGNLHVKDGKSVYVKVQMSFDDALKRTLVRNRKVLAQALHGPGNNTIKKDTKRNFNEMYRNINITRTTKDNSDLTTKIYSYSLTTKGKLTKDNSGGSKILIEVKQIDNII